MKRIILWLRANRHVWWALLLFYVLAVFFLAEKLVTTASHSTVTALDAYIPFFPPAIIVYYLWFPLLAVTGFWLIAKDGKGLRDYMWTLSVCFTLSVAVYFLWPNEQTLRPDLSAPCNVFERVLKGLYDFDSNTNVFPSLHVSGAVIAALAVWKSPSVRHRGVRIGTAVLAALVAVSTVLVKQHAAVDIPGGLAAALLSRCAVKLLKRKTD